MFDRLAPAVGAVRARLAPTVGAALDRLSAAARRVPFRLAVAAICMALQLVVATRSGVRFGAPFNASPGHPPAFNNPAVERNPARWNRLVVSRWDSGQYIELGLRGYQYCPPRGPEIPARSPTCNLAFYPSYGLLGRLVGRATGMPIDYALFAISLVSGFLFLFLWTGPALVSRLGLWETYLALVLFNTYTTGYCLVTIQTEPLTLALTMGAFVAMSRKRHVAGAFLAGAATGIRITGVAVGAAYAAALLVELGRERPRSLARWLRYALLMVVCGWGELTLMAIHAHRFGDPLAYVHAHAIVFKHHPSLGALLPPDPSWIMMALEYPLHEGVWLASALLWFLLGHREALRGFPLPERVFWYLVFILTVGIAAAGQLPIALAGMSRYLLLALPLFFATAYVLRRRPVLLLVWLVMTSWHYWNVDICFYTGGQGDRTVRICHAGHWLSAK